MSEAFENPISSGVQDAVFVQAENGKVSIGMAFKIFERKVLEASFTALVQGS